MEAAAAQREDGKTTEEAAGEGTEGLSLGFGCGSPGHLHRQPHHKLLRSDAFPFRVASSSSHAAAGVSTASDGRAAGPPPSPARTLVSPPNGGVNVGCGGGSGTAALGHGGISDSALRPVNSPVTGLAGDATLQLCSYFTAAQWQELHRQALIFKCFVTATPVPPDLLPARSPFSGGHPFFSNLSRGGDYLNLRFTGANADLEPGRCRRTDGKKWRCSREVAPGQKYCERHVHRARPRSRKPVELAGRADPAAAASAAETVSTAAKPAAARPSAQSSPAGLPTSGADDLKLPFQFLVPEDHKKLRYLGSSGGVRAEVLPATKHWQLPHPKMGLQQQQQHDGDNRLNLRCSSLNYDHHGCPFPGADISASDADPHDPRDAPRCFIDAWSRSESNPFDGVTIGDDHKTDSGGVRSLEYLSPSSSLTLSMSGVGGGEHHDHFQMGIHAAGKMLAPSWMMRRPASPIGGPLAEVLQTTSSSTVSFERAGRHESDAAARGGGGLIDLMCRTSCDSEGASPPRGFSSPTRVLQKALVSPSDSSSNSNSSPTFGLGRRPELGLQWASPYN